MAGNPQDPLRDAALLLDMLNAAQAIHSFVTGRTYHEYLADLMLRSAVERQVEIIGEAARFISDQFKLLTPRSPGGPSWPSAIVSRTSTARSTTP